ncbi:MAG: NAD-binding protein, partial [Candidatus Methanomethylophilaceae archaeon]|nr:NAD-binding protein [Candidatus Methanomethylophilaceae archaeon]
MTVIVVGAGKVGYIVAERLSREESNNVMVIENDPQAADKVAMSLNSSLINDTGSNPRVLRDVMKM